MIECWYFLVSWQCDVLVGNSSSYSYVTCSISLRCEVPWWVVYTGQLACVKSVYLFFAVEIFIKGICVQGVISALKTEVGGW